MSTSTTEHLDLCPCCRSRTIGELGNYEVCDVCGWEDDPVQSTDPDYAGGANTDSLNKARARWKEKSEI